MSDTLDLLAENSIYHHDMLVFLHTLNNSALSLTKTKRLKLKDIKALGKMFKYDIYCRDESGKILFPITTEDKVRFLLSLRALSRIMYLTYNRKGKVLLSKNGRGFIENISSGVRLTHLFLNFTFELNWEYLHPNFVNYKNISKILQKNVMFIYQYLIDSPSDSIKMSTFSKNLDNYFNLSSMGSEDDEWSVQLSIELSLIKELELFGILTIVDREEFGGKRVDSFSIIEGGKELLSRVFERRWGY